ncbi:DUF4097 family beta strand repeat-containing protein [Gracilimonas sp.]|uniref:DUF4097 family beta strand repeat-containing protein n=1 Tax=Gracilimonas sp. TaxID=1974203 RepID=UPI0028725ECE|nr:DUF4097 family beta strand repeat-containing protein [Gracilimonas sp.]
MKTSSWEIILAGFLFVGVAIYLIEQNSTSQKSTETATASDSIQVNFDEDDIRVFRFKSLENLENLQNLENLENLRNLRNLENLKNLSNILPAEVRGEFEAEIDAVMKEFDQESVNVSVNPEQGTVSIDKAISAESGGWTAVSPGVFVYVKEFDATSLKEAILSLPFGSIEVKGNSGTQSKLTIQASGQVSTRAELQSKISTAVNISPEKAAIELKPNSKKPQETNIQLHAILTLPKEIAVQMTTQGGHLSSENISGTQRYKTLGGHITLKNLSGEINAETGGGHIALSNGEGTITLNSRGGNIRSENSTGNLVMQTAGGSLQVYEFSGSVDAKTNGGNIELRLLENRGASAAITSAGSISIWIPKNGDIDFDLSGSSVKIASDLNFEGSQSAGSAKGTIGSGASSLTAKTNYGKVSVKPIN